MCIAWYNIVSVNTKMSLDPNEVLFVPLAFFKVCGLWQQDGRFRWPYHIYATIFQFIFMICYTGFKCLNFFFLTDANMITREVFICCSELSLFVKVFNFHYYQKEIKTFLANIRSFKFDSESEATLMNERFGIFSKILTFQVTCCVIAIIFSCGAPFFANEPVLP